MPDIPEEAAAFESPLRNPSSLPEEAVQAAAEVLYRHYDSEYGADHLSWRDFTEAAREVVEAAAPAIAAQAVAEERRKIAEQIADRLAAKGAAMWPAADDPRRSLGEAAKVSWAAAAFEEAANVARQIGEARG